MHTVSYHILLAKIIPLIQSQNLGDGYGTGTIFPILYEKIKLLKDYVI